MLTIALYKGFKIAQRYKVVHLLVSDDIWILSSATICQLNQLFSNREAAMHYKRVDLLVSDGDGVLVFGAHRGRARDAGQASLTNFLRDLNTFVSHFQELCSVFETFFVTSGFGGAPRPLLSLHIGQGGVVVTMLSENTKFLPT